MTFDELLAWAKKGTTADVFGYFRGNSGDTPFSGLSYLRAWGVEPVDTSGKKATFIDSKDAFLACLEVPPGPDQLEQGLASTGDSRQHQRGLRRPEAAGVRRVAVLYRDSARHLQG